MLLRYVGGTLLILGVAMVMTPEAEKRDEDIVARAATPDTAIPARVASATSRQGEAGSVTEQALDQETRIVEDETADQMPAPRQIEVPSAVVLQAALTADIPDSDDQQDLPEVLGLEQFIDPNDSTSDQTMTAETRALIAAVESGASDPAPAGPTLSATRTMIVTGTRVNVRSGPSTQYGVVSTVVSGEEVELVSLDGSGWARIRKLESGEAGFMSRRFLTDAPGG